jgi:1-acyl-sn-glycerol-3-phosphate acyltransferase
MVSADEVRGVQGWFIRRLGGFPINPRRPAIASLRYGIESLQSGEMLVIFPEGGIFRDNRVHTLKPGLARIALQAEAMQPGLDIKIVPVNLHYSHPFVQWGGGVNIRIGAPLSVSDYTQGTTKQSAQYLTADLEVALKGLSETEEPAAESYTCPDSEDAFVLTHYQ